MPSFRLRLIFMASLSVTLLAGCAAGDYSRGDDYESDDYESADHDWYENRQDEIGCMGDAVRSGVFPGYEYDRYVSNCISERESERDDDQH